jgi:hypothetical protein
MNRKALLIVAGLGLAAAGWWYFRKRTAPGSAHDSTPASGQPGNDFGDALAGLAAPVTDTTSQPAPTTAAPAPAASGPAPATITFDGQKLVSTGIVNGKNGPVIGWKPVP